MRAFTMAKTVRVTKRCMRLGIPATTKASRQFVTPWGSGYFIGT
jgi:hypothetical protein